MTPEQHEQLKSKMTQRIVGNVSFAEIVKILHALATKEVDFQLAEGTEEQKQKLYNELFVQNLPSEETPAE